MAQEIGILIQNGVHLKEHEYETVKVFLQKGYDVELIPPLQTKNAHTPDVVIDGRSWEMKAPTGNGKNTMRNIMHKASRQSGNIIIDLRRCKMDDEKAINEIVKAFGDSKKIRKVKIVTKSQEIIDIPK